MLSPLSLPRTFAAAVLALALALAAVPGRATAVGQSFSVPERIVDDCSRDVTRDLLAWFARVPNGGELHFQPGACYRIDGSLAVEDRWGLTFDGHGAVFWAKSDGGRDRRLWWLRGGGDLTLRDLTVRGANPKAGVSYGAFRPDRAFQHAFAAQGVQGLRLQEVAAYDVYGDFVYLGPDVGRRKSTGAWSRNVIVSDSRFERNGRQGIALTAVSDVVIRRNYLGDVRHAVFDLEPVASSWGVRRVTIRANITGPSRLLWLANGGQGHNVGDIEVIRNTMAARSGVPVIEVKSPAGGARGPYHVVGNHFIVGGSPSAALRFTRATGVIVENNVADFPAYRAMTAVHMIDSGPGTIRNNTWRGAALRVLRQ